MQTSFSTSALKQANAMPFKSLPNQLHHGLLASLESMQYEYMTPVQEKVLTTLPNLGSDCLVQAKTGTGKTLAFLIPALQNLITSPPVPKGQVGILILSPTRELAIQIAQECDRITAHMPKRIECHTAYGGSARASNLQKFMSGNPSVLVATPGRLNDYMSEAPTLAKFSDIRTVILDEVDTMLEGGFLRDVKNILRPLPPKRSGWQGMCFSATVPNRIQDVLDLVLRPGFAHISTIDKSEPPTHTRVPQYHVTVPSSCDTLVALSSLLTQEIKAGGSSPKIIVFGITARLAALYAELFQKLSNLPVYQLHSRLTQARRTKTTSEFKQATKGIMFATDVIGRGMDFPNVTSVIQVGLPADGDQYVHRVGRTARVDRDGRAVILLTQQESFFLAANPQLPIQPYTEEISLSDHASVSRAMADVDDLIKSRAYSSYLGFMSDFTKKLGISSEELVAMANRFALEAFKCPEIPAMEKKTVGRMGLRGVKGINIVKDAGAPNSRNQFTSHQQAPDQNRTQRRRPQKKAKTNQERSY